LSHLELLITRKFLKLILKCLNRRDSGKMFVDHFKFINNLFFYRGNDFDPYSNNCHYFSRALCVILFEKNLIPIGVCSFQINVELVIYSHPDIGML
jgi:hypothetical protein